MNRLSLKNSFSRPKSCFRSPHLVRQLDFILYRSSSVAEDIDEQPQENDDFDERPARVVLVRGLDVFPDDLVTGNRVPDRDGDGDGGVHGIDEIHGEHAGDVVDQGVCEVAQRVAGNGVGCHGCVPMPVRSLRYSRSSSCEARE